MQTDVLNRFHTGFAEVSVNMTALHWQFFYSGDGALYAHIYIYTYETRGCRRGLRLS